jgi:alkyl hydroperoxide reductase subunit AhpF
LAIHRFATFNWIRQWWGGHPPKVSRGGTPILEPKEPFDVLVVGGGPAGSAAAVYAARKGIRTGLVAERFGGPLLKGKRVPPRLTFAIVRHNSFDSGT